MLLTEPLQVSHDRVDDLPVLLELVCRLDLPILLDQCLGGHGLHQGLSNGWVAAVWLVYILSEGDHRKAEVQAWAEAHRPSLERLLGQSLRATEFNDDRLGIVLRRLAETAGWETLEAPLWRRTVAVHARWPPWARYAWTARPSRLLHPGCGRTDAAGAQQGLPPRSGSTQADGRRRAA